MVNGTEMAPPGLLKLVTSSGISDAVVRSQVKTRGFSLARTPSKRHVILHDLLADEPRRKSGNNRALSGRVRAPDISLFRPVTYSSFEGALFVNRSLE
jgi:hypothetical protein